MLSGKYLDIVSNGLNGENAMTKKDYILIAEVIKQCHPVSSMPKEWRNGCESAMSYIARHLADEMKKDNSRFNRERFLNACGVTDL
jgi:hypothetical protein